MQDPNTANLANLLYILALCGATVPPPSFLTTPYVQDMTNQRPCTFPAFLYFRTLWRYTNAVIIIIIIIIIIISKMTLVTAD